MNETKVEQGAKSIFAVKHEESRTLEGFLDDKGLKAARRYNLQHQKDSERSNAVMA
jgi:hypothetical protein